MHADNRTRWKAGAAAIAVHVLVACGLLFGLAGRRIAATEPTIATFDVANQPSPPPAPVLHPRTARKAGAAAPRNIRSHPTEIVAPPPAVPRIIPPPLVTASVRGTGSQATAGASDRPGPGTGAGGSGNGSGSGGEGDGDGDGGIPPRLVHGRIRDSDYPRDLTRAGIGGTVGVRYRVEIDGRASGCRITRSSGNARLDALTCRLIEERFRFDPARDEGDRKVSSELIENHTWVPDTIPDQESAPEES